MSDEGFEGIIAAIGPLIASAISQLKPMASGVVYSVNPGATAAQVIQPRSLVSTIANQLLGMPQNNDMNPLAHIGSGAISPMQAMQASENARRMYHMQRATASTMFSAGVTMGDTALQNWGVKDIAKFRELSATIKDQAAGSAAMGAAIQFGSTWAQQLAGQFGMFTTDSDATALRYRNQFLSGRTYDVKQSDAMVEAAKADMLQIRKFQATGDVDGEIRSLIPDTRFSRGFTDAQLFHQRTFLRAKGVTGLDDSAGMNSMAGAYKEASGLLGTTDSDALNRFIQAAGGNSLSGVKVQQLEAAFKNLTAMATTLNVSTENFSRSVLGLQQRTATAGGLSGTALAAGGGGLLGNNALLGGGASAALRLDAMANKAGISSEQMQDVYAAQLGDFRGSMQGRTLAYYNTADKATYDRLKAVAMTGNQGAWNKAMQGALASTFGSYTAGRSALADPRLQEIMFGNWNQDEQLSVTQGARNASRREQIITEEANSRYNAAAGKYGAYSSSDTSNRVRGQSIINALSGEKRAMAEQAFKHGGTRQLENLLSQQSFADVRDTALAAGKVGVAKHLEDTYGETHARYNAVNAIAALADQNQQKQLRAIATAIRSGKVTGEHNGVLAGMLQQDPRMQALFNESLSAERATLEEASRARNLSNANIKLGGLLTGNAENAAKFAEAAKNGTGVELSGSKITEEQVRLLHGRRQLLLSKYGSSEEQHNLEQNNVISESDLQKTMAENRKYAEDFERRNPLMYDDLKVSAGKLLLNRDQASLGAMLGNDKYAPYMNALNQVSEGKNLKVEDSLDLAKIGHTTSLKEYAEWSGDKGMTPARFGELTGKRQKLLEASALLTADQNNIYAGNYDAYKGAIKRNGGTAISEDMWGAVQSLRKAMPSAAKPGSAAGDGEKTSEKTDVKVEVSHNGKPLVDNTIRLNVELFGGGMPDSALG